MLAASTLEYQSVNKSRRHLCNIPSGHGGWQKKRKKRRWQVSHEVARPGWLGRESQGKAFWREDTENKSEVRDWLLFWGQACQRETNTNEKAWAANELHVFGIVRSSSLIHPTKWGVVGKYHRRFSEELDHSSKDILCGLTIIGSHFLKVILRACAEWVQRKKSRHEKMLDSSCRVTMNLARASGGMGRSCKHRP